MSFSKCYTPRVEIKYFNVLTDRKTLDTPIKKKHRKRFLIWEEIMTTKQGIYWIVNILQINTN